MAETTFINKKITMKFVCKTEGCEFQSTKQAQRIAHETILGHINYDCIEVENL